MINGISALTSFKGCVPVKHFALYPKDNKYHPVTKRENLTKCQGFVTRNLNGTAKNMRNQEFIDLYKSYDKDYLQDPVVQSVYDEKTSTIYMVTGKDTDVIKQAAKPVGRAKRESIDTTGNTKSPEVRNAANQYIRDVKWYIKHSCRQVESPNGDKLELHVYFLPKYGRDGKVKSFTYQIASFVPSNNNK